MFRESRCRDRARGIYFNNLFYIKWLEDSIFVIQQSGGRCCGNRRRILWKNTQLRAGGPINFGILIAEFGK